MLDGHLIFGDAALRLTVVSYEFLQGHARCTRGGYNGTMRELDLHACLILVAAYAASAMRRSGVRSFNFHGEGTLEL